MDTESMERQGLLLPSSSLWSVPPISLFQLQDPWGGKLECGSCRVSPLQYGEEPGEDGNWIGR